MFVQFTHSSHRWYVFPFMLAVSQVHIFQSFHPSMDLAYIFRLSFRRSLLHPVWCARSMGCGMSVPGHSSLHSIDRSKWMQIPIQLAEMSPPAFRATFPGVVYQLGNVRHANLFCLMFVTFSYHIPSSIDDLIGSVSNWSKCVELSLLKLALRNLTIVSSLAGAKNLKTTIMKNGILTIVPDYGAVCNLFLYNMTNGNDSNLLIYRSKVSSSAL